MPRSDVQGPSRFQNLSLSVQMSEFGCGLHSYCCFSVQTKLFLELDSELQETNIPDLSEVSLSQDVQTNAKANKPDLSEVPPRLTGRRAGDTEATSSAVVYLLSSLVLPPTIL